MAEGKREAFEDAVQHSTSRTLGGSYPNIWRHSLWYLVKSSRRLITLLAAMSTILTAWDILLFWLVGSVIDDLANNQFNWTSGSVGLLLLLLLLRPLAQYIYLHVKSERALPAASIESRLMLHQMFLADSRNRASTSSGIQFAARVMHVGGAYRQMLRLGAERLLSGFVSFLTALVLFMFTAPLLATPLVIWLVMYAIHILWWVKHNKRTSTHVSECNAKASEALVNLYERREIFRQGNLEGLDPTIARLNRLWFAQRLQGKVSKKTISLVWGLNSMLIVLVGGFSSILWDDGLLSSGEVASTIAVLLRLQGVSMEVLGGVTEFTEHYSVFKNAVSSLDTFGIGKHPKAALNELAAPARLPGRANKLIIRDVTVTDENDVTILNGMSLVAERGIPTYILGASGNGKSTILSAIEGSARVQSGSISIESDTGTSRPIEPDVEVWLEPSSSGLLQTSIRRNFRFVNRSISDYDIRHLLQVTEALEALEKVADVAGVDPLRLSSSVVCARLSKGELQRVHLARALASDRKLLLLDEPTSALDNETEKRVWSAVLPIIRNRITIVVTHTPNLGDSSGVRVIVEQGRLHCDFKASDHGPRSQHRAP